MLKDWLLGKVSSRALDSSTKEVDKFVTALKGLGDRDLGAIVAIAAGASLARGRSGVDRHLCPSVTRRPGSCPHPATGHVPSPHQAVRFHRL